MNYLPIIIFALMVLGVIGVFIWADYQVKKRNREEYERTGVMPEYKPSDTTEYLWKFSAEYKKNRYMNRRKYSYIESGIGCVVCGPLALFIYICQLVGKGTENIQPLSIIWGVLLAGLVVYGIYALIKGIKMK